jgi:hypothetical protein
MASVNRKIGLSLGADICWPICYEEIVKRLQLNIPYGGDSINFHVERVTVAVVARKRKNAAQPATFRPDK